MRHFFQGLVIAAITILASTAVMAGDQAADQNQQTAQTIAKKLQESGKLGDSKIRVQFQDGTAWLQGQVKSDEQMATLMKAAFSTAGVNRVINNMTVASDEPAADSKWLGRPTAPKTDSNTQTSVLLQPIASAMEPDRVARSSGERMSAPRPGQAALRQPALPKQETAQVQPTSAIEPAEEPAMPLPPQPTEMRQPRSAQAPAQARRNQPVQGRPIPVAYRQASDAAEPPAPLNVPNAGAPQPMYSAPVAAGPAPYRQDQPSLPNYAWPSYAAYPNYAALTYPKQYSPTVWPYIGPFYPYPQVPLGWRKVTLEWDDGWWWLDFKNTPSCKRSPVGRHY